MSDAPPVRRGRILVGTAAWSDLNQFYPPGVRGTDKITYYSRNFRVVEVNASYYALLPEKNYAMWARKTPDDFTFNVKALGQLTGHDRAEDPSPEVFNAFRKSYAALREAGKLGSVLFQFPPWFENTERNQDRLTDCVDRMAGDHLLIEFRNRSWLDETSRQGTLELLERLAVSYVTVDAPQAGTGTVPLVPAVTNPRLGYLRLHGRNTETWYRRVENTGQRFNYKYDDDELAGLADVARELSASAETVHVIFNNNMANYGTTNARAIMRLLGLEPPEDIPTQTRMDF